jgi:hypothetical protein
MAKKKNQPDPKKPAAPQPPAPPHDDIEEIHDLFVDEAAAPAEELEAIEEVEEVEAIEDDAAHSVIDEDLSHFKAGGALDSDQVSGVFSSVARVDADSKVDPLSDIIKAEPLSDTAAIEPIAEAPKAKADSDVRTEKTIPVADDEIVEVVDDGVLADEMTTHPKTEEFALPESAVKGKPVTGEDAIGGELGGVLDSSVSLNSFKSFKGKAPEKEQILDLDETLASIESPEPQKREVPEPTIAIDPSGSDADFNIEEIVQEEAVNFGARETGKAGIDPVAESLESGVRLESETKPKARPAAPSVEFDDLVVEDEIAPIEDEEQEIVIDDVVADEIVEAVDEEPAKPAKRIAKPVAAPVAAGDDINIEDLLGDELATPADSAVTEPVADDLVEASAEEEPVVAADEFAEPEPEPVTTPAKKAKAELPYQEPRKAGWGGAIGGTLVGILLAGGAAGGIWYADLIPSSPNAPQRAVPVVQTQEGGADPAKLAEAVKAAEKAQEENKTLMAQLDTAKTAAMKADDDLKAAAKEKEAAETAVNEIKKAIVAAKLDDKGEVDPAKLKSAVDDFMKDKAVAEAVNKLLKDAKIDDAGEKGVEKLVAERKDAVDKLTEVGKVLEGEKVKEQGAKGVQEILTNRDKIAKERDEFDQAVKEAVQELAMAKLVPDDADLKKAIVQGAKSARVKSESPLGGPLSSLAGSLGNLTLGVGDLVGGAIREGELVAEVNFLRASNALAPSPARQLDRFAAALENRDQKDPQLLKDATNLTTYVLSDKSGATPADKAKATYVLALVQRNQLNYEEARKAAESIKDAIATWGPGAQQAYRELVEPATVFLPRIEKLRAESNNAAALKEIDAALKVMPDNPRLLAERSMINVERLRDGVDAKTQESIRADAEVARKDPKTAAAATLALGKLEEAAGRPAEAEKLYREALKAADGDEQQSAQISLALGRLLLRSLGGEIPVAAPAAPAQPKEETPKEEKDSVQANPVGPRLSGGRPLVRMVVGLMLSQPPVIADPEDESSSARVKETIDLARRLIESKDKRIQAQGYMLLGEALSRAGQRTEGLKEYAKGLEMLQPGAQFGKLLDEHPAFQVPDAMQRANPILAEKHYGIGLHLYQQRKFAEAETQFKQAVSYFDKDARYLYYLGLCQLEQGSKNKRDAALYSWEQASRLEANSRPNTAEVNLALERIQGSRRVLLDGYRSRTAVVP